MSDLDSNQPRSDSVIESKLTHEQAQTLFDEIEAGLTMKEAVEYLREKHAITLSPASVSRWCKRRRRWRLQDDYDEAINWAHVGIRRCENLVEASASTAQLLEGNLVLASQEFFNANLTNDRRRQRHAARMLAAVTNAARVLRNQPDSNLLTQLRMNPHLAGQVLESVEGAAGEQG